MIDFAYKTDWAQFNLPMSRLKEIVSECEKGSFGSLELDRKFLRDLKKLPFSPQISENKAGKELLRGKDIKSLLKFILEEDGLNYGNLPKALIPFHRYQSGELRAALEEHFVEAAGYFAETGGVGHLHFTISAEHKQDIVKYMLKYCQNYTMRKAIRDAAQARLAFTKYIFAKTSPPDGEFINQIIFLPP